ncbi:HNH endonuclease [Candidatus Microgenomates bacterium]|nr:HNH endonuclease [Candidatus Microgenomates bacterium]
MSVHHIIPKKDFKENPTLQKHLGYGAHDLINLITLCKTCHQAYEKAKLTICLQGVEHKRDRPEAVNLKQLTKEARKMRRSLKKMGISGWGKLSEDERLNLILLLMKWLSKEYVDWAEYEDDDY